MLSLRRKSDDEAVGAVTRSERREAIREARRDAATGVKPPSAYQQHLQKECDRTIRVDLEQRHDEFADLLSEKAAAVNDRVIVAHRIEEVGNQLSEAEGRLSALPRPHWVGRLGGWEKWLLLLGLGGFEYVLIRSAVDLLDLDEGVKNLTAALIGVVPIIAIEINGAHLLEMLGYHRERIDRQRSWLFGASIIGALGAVIVGFIIAIGVVRADGLAANGIIINDISFPLPGSYERGLAVSLALLQTIATLAAVAVTRQQAGGEGWRALNTEVRRYRGTLARRERDAERLAESSVEAEAQFAVFREAIEQRHLAILDRFASREALYRLIFSRVHPDAKEKLAIWDAWQEKLLDSLKRVYARFGAHYEMVMAPDDEREPLEDRVADIEHRVGDIYGMVNNLNERVRPERTEPDSTEERPSPSGGASETT